MATLSGHFRVRKWMRTTVFRSGASSIRWMLAPAGTSLYRHGWPFRVTSVWSVTLNSSRVLGAVFRTIPPGSGLTMTADQAFPNGVVGSFHGASEADARGTRQRPISSASAGRDMRRVLPSGLIDG